MQTLSYFYLTFYSGDMAALQQLGRKTSKKKTDDENAPKDDWGGWVSFSFYFCLVR